jgi:polysaccharide biosynthesis protein PslH
MSSANMELSHKKILLVTNNFPEKALGGRELLSKLIYSVLYKIFSTNLEIFFLTKPSTSKEKKLLGFFCGHMDGLNKESLELLMHKIEQTNVDIVFTNGSNLGAFVKIARKKFPNVRFVTFFHNVEFYFFLSLFIKSKNPKSLFLAILIFFAERKAVMFSNTTIALNQRDSAALLSFYGDEAHAIFPMALEDQYSNVIPFARNNDQEEYILFVGGLFYANEYGIRWFIKNVVPEIKIKLLIVGRGFERLRDELEVQNKVQVIGATENLEKYYINAKFIIAPIFDGSGMKTKIAEAMMYGKKVIGTTEAFVGYEDHLPEAGWLCNSKVEFVQSIMSSNEGVDNQGLNNNLRKIFQANYSLESAEIKMRNILSN